MSTSFQVKVWYMFNSKPTITTAIMHCINECHGNFEKKPVITMTTPIVTSINMLSSKL